MRSAPVNQKPSGPGIVGWVLRLAGLLVFAGAWVLVGGFLLPKPREQSQPQQQQTRNEEVALPQKAHANGEMAEPSGDDEPDEPSELPADLDTFVVTAAGGPLSRPKDQPIIMPELPPGGGPLELAVAIDKEIDRALGEAKAPPSPVAGDAEFLRRAYLDITGHIPTYDETVAFLGSKDPYKRSKLIDELLASPTYGRHLANVWCDLIVKHDFDNNKTLKTDAFVAWLADKFNRGAKWDVIVKSLLTADGKEGQNPATFFFLANQDNNQPSPAKLVGATGNFFMGIQIQCCECHVHPFNSKWKPSDFWGMAAFFGHVRADRDTDAKGKPKLGTASFMEVERRAEPKGKAAKKNGEKAITPGPTIAIPDPTNPKRTLGTASAKYFEGVKPPVNHVPYRPNLASWVASNQNGYFAPAMVNRTWAHFFARGFVNPIDDMKDDNPPAHPGAFKLLASEFTRSGYDLKFLIRTICNTRAYQRTSRPLPDNAADDKLFSHMQIKVLSAEALLDALATATSHDIAKNTSGPAAGKRQMPIANAAVRYFDTREPDDDPTDFSYGVPQVLRLMNTGLTNSSAEVIQRLAKPGTPKEKVMEDIFLTALSRRPSDSESQRMLAYVAKQKDPMKGYTGVFWALLNSAEFACNR